MFCPRRLFSSAANSHPPLLARYKVVPEDLFRIQSGPKVSLREFSKQMAMKRTSFDLKAVDGIVHPRKGDFFEGPNGMSVRPNNYILHEILSTFRSKNIHIYRLPKGLELPSNLVVLHEHSTHFSVQCDEPMTLKDLNRNLTRFLNDYCELLPEVEFNKRFPNPMPMQ